MRTQAVRYQLVASLLAICSLLGASTARSDGLFPVPCSAKERQSCTLRHLGSVEARPSVRIACLENGHFFYRAHPTNCAFFARFKTEEGERVRDIGARSLVWSNWGRRFARAVGRSLDGHRLVVLAYHRMSCGGRRRDYGFVRVRRPPSDRVFRMKLATCGAQRL